MSRVERHRELKRKRRRRAKIVLVTLFVILLLAGTGLAAAAWYFSPEHHFANVSLPVLGQPSASQTPPAQQGQGGSGTPANVPTHVPTPTPAPAPASQQQSASFNVLILGIDAPESADARTDAIMVAHVNTHDKTVNLVSVPRDTRVNIPGVGYTKINHAHFLGNLQNGNHGGTEASVQAVTDFLNVPINYYVKTNFQGFTHLVDTIGGVDVTFPQAVGSFTAGPHHLNGDQALEAVRERYSLPNGDLGRESDQALVLNALMEKVLQPSNIPRLPTLYKQVRQDLIDTNFTDSDLISLALLFKGLNHSQVHYVQIPGHGGTAYDPLVKADLSYLIPDLDAVKRISETYMHDK